MVLPSFEFRSAHTIDEAINFAKMYGPDAHYLAGGTSLIPMMKCGLVKPSLLVSLSDIAELRGIRSSPNGGLEIAALATHRDIELSSDVNRYCRTLSRVFSEIASVRIRNQATLGGNLVHADPAQDPPPILMVLDATVVVAGKHGQRIITMDKFFANYFETVIEPGEILTEIRLPPLSPNARTSFKKFLPRTHDDYATVSVAAKLEVSESGKCTDIHVALGAAGVTPIMARHVEKALSGQFLDPETIREAANLVVGDVDPLTDNRGSRQYKSEMARVYTARVLNELMSEAMNSLVH